MINTRPSMVRNQAVISVVFWTIAVFAAWKVGGWLSRGDLNALAYSAIGLVVSVIGIAILRNWRSGFYVFVVWLLFEDLIRKFMGNNMLIFFAKDALVAVMYVSFLAFIRRKRTPLFRPSFLMWFSLFFWLGAIQVFNPNSPSLFYGLLGFKLFFYYFPLIFVGYALIRDDSDLHRFIVINMVLASVIATLGIVQAVVGPGFLNPAVLAPEIRELSTLERSAPISGVKIFRPSSVFVSDGRFAMYLTMMWILGLGASAYYFFRQQHRRRGQIIVLIGAGLVAVAIALCGSRGAFVESSASTLVLIAAFVWGTPWRSGQAHRLMKAMGRVFWAGAFALLIAITFFPETIGAHWAFYYETLSPTSPYSELVSRGRDYPTDNLIYAFTQANWMFGNGIGTASMGGQYVSRLLGERHLDIGVESGWGNLMLEMGIPGLILWLAWTTAAVFSCWRVVHRLRQTAYFTMAFAVWWFVFLVLVPMTYNGLNPYENYIYNAYLWLLMGILFKLPTLAFPPQLPAHPCA